MINCNSFICVTHQYSYRLLKQCKRLKSNNKTNFKRLETDKMTQEDILQISCIKWFRYQYPGLRKMLFAVPNGGKRESRINQYGNRYSPEAQKLERMGVIAGVSDLILLTPMHGYGALCIEMKVGKGKQSLTQHEWELEAISAGNKYVICRSIDEFIKEVNQYLTH